MLYLYNKQLLKIPNFEVVQLQSSLDSGFIEYIAQQEPITLEINSSSINNFGSPLQYSKNLSSWPVAID